MDIASFLLFFFVVVPLGLMITNNHIKYRKKTDSEFIAAQKETNRLLTGLLETKKQ
ncbi:MAG: hypothetical protein NTV38_09610 [Chloroflexi bacterium]|nr:hypothetical protein [Chloroflexota bacterium]